VLAGRLYARKLADADTAMAMDDFIGIALWAV
jgi:hypothetical protein